MPKRAKVLVVDSDLHALSRIYLFLLHRDYKVEASDNAEEILPRVDRFKPKLVIAHERSRNLDNEIFQQLSRQRVHIFLLGESLLPIEEIKRLQRFSSSTDLHVIEEKIRETLDIWE